MHYITRNRNRFPERLDLVLDMPRFGMTKCYLNRVCDIAVNEGL